MKILTMLQVSLGAALLSLTVSSMAIPAPATSPASGKTYTQNEIVNKAAGFFGDTTEGLAKAVERVFKEKGSPNGYITGTEASGAVGVGLRYGEGDLYMKSTGDQTRQGVLAGTVGRLRRRRQRVEGFHADLQSAEHRDHLSALSRRRRQRVFHRRSRRELPAIGEHHSRAHAHRRGPARRRERRLSALFEGTQNPAVLSGRTFRLWSAGALPPPLPRPSQVRN